jgi:hypothetical protein
LCYDHTIFIFQGFLEEKMYSKEPVNYISKYYFYYAYYYQLEPWGSGRVHK